MSADRAQPIALTTTGTADRQDQPDSKARMADHWRRAIRAWPAGRLRTCLHKSKRVASASTPPTRTRPYRHHDRSREHRQVVGPQPPYRPSPRSAAPAHEHSVSATGRGCGGVGPSALGGMAGRSGVSPGASRPLDARLRTRQPPRPRAARPSAHSVYCSPTLTCRAPSAGRVAWRATWFRRGRRTATARPTVIATEDRQATLGAPYRAPRRWPGRPLSIAAGSLGGITRRCHRRRGQRAVGVRVHRKPSR